MINMTQDEKAKRYDEVAKEIKGFFEGKQKMPNDVGKTLELLFPELKESEDERIRKAIISGMTAIKGQGKETFATIRINDCIAWLEEQGDKDKLIKELGEYKVKYTQDVLEKHLNCMNNKDDERLRKTTIAFLKEFADKGYENAVECIAWLEKQSDKPKGKTALEAINEEKVDNQFCVKPVNETSIAVNNPDSYKIGFADGEAYVKEQQWKPTDGQMEVLKGIIADKYVLDAYKGILKGLQEQLKKLRGE